MSAPKMYYIKSNYIGILGESKIQKIHYVVIVGAIVGLLIGLTPSFGVLATNWIKPESPSTTVANQQVITGHDSDKEINDQSTANTQTSDDHNAKADPEINDDHNTNKQTVDDHNAKADPETNDDGK
jgi:hypothetical protein